MGIFKKKGDDESDRNALFGNRKGKASPAGSNPYAEPPTKNDPYANAPPPYSGGNDSFRQDKSPAVTGPGQRYGGGGYGAQGGSYGGGGGYGGDRYGSGDQGPRRAGGYGGMGNTDPNNEEDRGALFGGAADRYQQRQQPGQGQQSGAYGQSGVSGAYGDSGYGNGPSYDDRQLTAEEQEEEDVNATKNEIKFMKQQDVSSTRNALRLAQQAEETGRDTLARLGAQGERIHNTERNLDLASSQNRIAEEKARELKTLNRSMFAVHVSNPFTSNSRREERDRKIMVRNLGQREGVVLMMRRTRIAQNETREMLPVRQLGNLHVCRIGLLLLFGTRANLRPARQDDFKKGMQGGGGAGPGRSTLADRAKFQVRSNKYDSDVHV